MPTAGITQLLIQTGVTFVAASLGAIFGALLTRRTEQFKHLQELRSTAYADFLIGFAKVTRAQNANTKDDRTRLEEYEGSVLLTNARARIAIYGGAEVVQSLSRFVELGTQTHTPAGRKAFADLCSVMRTEAGRKGASFEDLAIVLFSAKEVRKTLGDGEK